MFRDDFEFHDAAGPSHHGGHAPKPIAPATAPARPAASSSPEVAPTTVAYGTAPAEAAEAAVAPPALSPDSILWHPDAERELKKIPFFVRGKARRNTEKFAAERGLTAIALETLYDAKAHYAR